MNIDTFFSSGANVDGASLEPAAKRRVIPEVKEEETISAKPTTTPSIDDLGEEEDKSVAPSNKTPKR